MRTPKLARAKPLVVAALLAIGFAGSAYAQSVQFIGTTGGCFFPTGGTACTPVNGVGGTTQGLTYNPGGFDVLTYLGGASIGGDALDNFGKFTSVAPTTGDFNYAGTSFNLLITFTNPTAAGTLFSAVLTGAVAPGPAGSTILTFAGAPQYFGANNMYSVKVNPSYSVTPGQVVYVTGDVTATTVPEPISMVLLGTGLLGLGAVRRRRGKRV